MDDDDDGEGNADGHNVNQASSTEKIRYNWKILWDIFSKMDLPELLNARLVCQIWNDEVRTFIRHFNKTIEIPTDVILNEYVKSDRYLFPSVRFYLGNLSSQALSNCKLRYVKHLSLKGNLLHMNLPDLDYFSTINQFDLDWFKNRIWDVKEKILMILQFCNTLTSMSLHLFFPVNVCDTEANLLPDLPKMRDLTIFYDSYYHNFALDDIGVTLIRKCPSLQYITIHLKDSNFGHSLVVDRRHAKFLNFLIELLHGRGDLGYSIPTLEICPTFAVNIKNFEKLNQLADLKPQFKVLNLNVCEGIITTRDEFIQTYQAVERILQTTAGNLENLMVKIFAFQCDADGNVREPEEFVELNIPPLSKVQSLGIDADFEEGDGYDEFHFVRLPSGIDDFPNLKELTFNCTCDIQQLSFPSLRSIELPKNFVYSQEFLFFALTKLTSIREILIRLPRYFNRYELRAMAIMGEHEHGPPYFDAWSLFTGGDQPPPHVVPPLNAQDDIDNINGDARNVPMIEENDGDFVMEENAALEEFQPNDRVASLQNLTNLRKLEIINCSYRDFQAVVYMTKFRRMARLKKLCIRSWDPSIVCFLKVSKYMAALKGYHHEVDVSVGQ